MPVNNHKDNKNSKDNLPAQPGLQPKRVPRGAQLRSELSAISQRVDQLEQKINSLPFVDDKGNSECHWAENLYAEKELLEAKVSSDVKVLSGYLVCLEKEIKRCRKNCQRIQSDYGKLHRQETMECYLEAEKAQERQLRSAIQDKDAVYIVLAKAKAVLQVSQTRKFPGREPQLQSPFPVIPSGSIESQNSHTFTTGLGNELEGLLSLGPLSDIKGL